VCFTFGWDAQLLEPLPPRRAFDEGDLHEDHVAARELVEDFPGRDGLVEPVRSRLDRSRLPQGSPEDPEAEGLGEQAFVEELLRDRFQARALLHREIEGLARKRERLRDEPGRVAAAREDRDGDEQREEPKEPSQ
jgi:hypothetical protein